MSINQDPLHSKFPHLETVETLIGIPIFPKGFDVNKALEANDPERCDVRVKAYQLALSAITHVTGKAVDDITSLKDQELNRVAENDDLHFLRSLVVIANNIYHAAATNAYDSLPGTDAPTTPRAQQQAKITQKLFKHSQTVPKDLEYSPTIPLREQFDDTMVVVSPTGSGKTHMEAALMRAAGIGKPMSDADPRPLRGILATSEVNILRQFAGKRDNSFRTLVGDATITTFYAKSKNRKGDITLTTGHSLPKLDSRDYNMAVIDEGHLALAPNTLKHIGSMGIRCFLFTATPAYNRLNDLRRHFRYIDEGTVPGYIEAGILNRTRLLTFQYDTDPEAMAASIAQEYLKAGRKVVVYCQAGTSGQPGGPSRRVATLVNDLMGTELAKAVGSHNKRSNHDLEAFERGDIRLVATSRMLREGANVPGLTVAILIGPNYSILDVVQKAGRPLRIAPVISELVELLPRHKKDKRPMVSIWQVMGLEYVDSGLIIGPKEEEDTEDSLKPQGHAGLFNTADNNEKSFYEDESGVSLSGLADSLKSAIVIDKPLREITLGEYTRPPEGSIQSSTLAASQQVPLGFLHHTLDKRGFSYVGLWSPTEDGWDYDRWYEKDVVDYLKQHPIPKETSHIELIAQDAAEMCNVSKNFFLKVASELSIVPVSRLGKHHNLSMRYSLDQIIVVSHAIEAIPLAEETDVPIVDLQRELSTAFVPNTLGVYKRRHPSRGLKGWCQHISAGEVERLRNEYYSIPVADENHKGTPELAALAGISLEYLRESMTEVEKAALMPMRKRRGAAPTDHMHVSVAAPLVERLKREALPPYMVTLSVIAEIIPRSKPILTQWLENNGYTMQLIRVGKRRPPACYSWQAVQKLEEKYGRREGVDEIDYSRLIQDVNDKDPERWQYSLEVQKRFIDERFLTPLPLTMTSSEIEDRAIAGIPVRRVATPRVEKPIRSTSQQKMPEGTIDLTNYLDEVGAPCRPNLLPILIQRLGLQRAFKDDKGRLWAPDETALVLEQEIKRFPLAEPHTASPYQIANEFKKLRITERHVVHLAPQLVSSLEGRTRLRRVLGDDGKAGELQVYYDAPLTISVRRRLSIIATQPAKLIILLRFGNL